jgi:antitoxin component of MazEF toxin-antitoxin module
MTITKQVPAGLLQALGLHKGDFMTVKDESSLSFVVEITSAKVPANSKAVMDHRQTALAKFAAGTAIAQSSTTEQELDDGRYEYLRAKHLK